MNSKSILAVIFCCAFILAALYNLVSEPAEATGIEDPNHPYSSRLYGCPCC